MTYGRSDIKSPFIFATTLRISDKLSLQKIKMPTHSETKILKYQPEQMFELVADVNSYPNFSLGVRRPEYTLEVLLKIMKY